jgi:ketosteroid isomerase-like protein
VRRTVVFMAGVLAFGAGFTGAAEPTEQAIRTWLSGYDAAFRAKDLSRLAAFYHPDVTIYEGGGVNTGWADYRDHHLGPELEEMTAPAFSRSNVNVHMLDKDARSAYVTSEYRLKTRLEDRDVDATGLETLVVVKGADGAWKIRHSHTSSRRRPPSPAPSPPGDARE